MLVGTLDGVDDELDSVVGVVDVDKDDVVVDVAGVVVVEDGGDVVDEGSEVVGAFVVVDSATEVVEEGCVVDVDSLGGQVVVVVVSGGLFHANAVRVNETEQASATEDATNRAVLRFTIPPSC